jgi:putative addiction module component (TIGR02574 family)
MNADPNHAELFKLPPNERLALAEQLWESVAAERENEPVPESVLTILRERIARYEANPDDVIPWDDVKRKLRNG